MPTEHDLGISKLFDEVLMSTVGLVIIPYANLRVPPSTSFADSSSVIKHQFDDVWYKQLPCFTMTRACSRI